jgi:integrase
MKVLSSMWNFGINHFRGPDNEPLLIVNPVELVKKTIERWEYPATPRRPIIDINHIGRFIATLEQRIAQFPSPQSSKEYNERQGYFLLLLCLFTGMRVGEAIRLKWDDINLDAGYLDLELTKNGRSHRVIFSSYVWAMIRKIKNTRTKISPYLFPLWSDPSRHTYITLPVFKRLPKELDLYFSTHSMRRTFRGVCRTLKMDPDDVKRLLNHRHKGDVTDLYDSGFNPDLPRQYWQQVADFLEEKRNLYTGDTATCQHNGAQLVAWLSDQGISLDEAETLIAHMRGAATNQVHPPLKLAG